MTSFIKQEGSGDYKELHLDSRDADISNTFIIDGALNIKKIFLTEMAMPFSWYTTNSNNNKIDFMEGITPVTAIIPIGNYDQISIIPAIKTAMELVSPGLATFSLSINVITFKLTITSTVTFSLLFGTGTNLLQSASDLMGFSAVDTLSALSHIGTGIINLTGELYIFLKLEQTLSPGNYNNGINTSINSLDRQILAKIAVNSNPGDIVYYKPQTIIPITISKNIKDVINGFKILLTFRDNIPIDLNGKNWNIKLGIITY